MLHRSDYDFDVISGPSTRLPPPPAPPPRPSGAPAQPMPVDGGPKGGAAG